MKNKKKLFSLFLALCIIVGCLTGCDVDSVMGELGQEIGQEISNSIYSTEPTTDAKPNETKPSTPTNPDNNTGSDVDIEAGNATIVTDVELLAKNYTGSPYVAVNNNVPYFGEDEKKLTKPFELYSDLDSLGRVGVAYANICRELMPTEDRESLSSVTPTGWHNKSYDFVDAKWVYNRAHIIGFQLAGEQANELNLMTGTRYFNVKGMLPFENMVADYVRETNNHVLYRVTPIFVGNNLLAEGVLMEAWSVEDNGDGVCFNVFCYNVEPGVAFDYVTGENWASGSQPIVDSNNNTNNDKTMRYILNTSSKKFHLESCSSVKQMLDKNKKEYAGSRQELIDDGYKPCGSCNP